MKQELTNIFVPYHVAKLAFEKGFTEWCLAYQSKDEPEPLPNFRISTKESRQVAVFDYPYISDDSHEEYGIPTHLQLIVWLKSKHDIDVTMQINGFWIVLDIFGRDTYFEDENEFEINKALEIGLNLLPNYEHDKQEYL